MRREPNHTLLLLVRTLTLTTLGMILVSSPAAAQRRASVRRGLEASTDARASSTHATITLGRKEYDAAVDAQCAIDERATATNGRFYYHVLYPWFGAHPPADQPQWRFELGVARPTRPETFDHLMFSFLDGASSATIQQLNGAQRMGSGTVRIARHGAGARFDVEGRSKEGSAVRATIDCASFPPSEGEGG